MTESSDASLADTGCSGSAPAQYLPIVYDELRKLAGHYLRGEPNGHTLQPTALVHEAYLRLLGDKARVCMSREDFFAVTSQAMRRLLIDHARRRRAAKRGGGARKVSLDEILEPTVDCDAYVVALDDALTELAAIDPPLCRVVELRFFGGMSVEETARILGISTATVKREWRLAKGWLHREMSRTK